MPYPESCPACGSTFRNTGTHFTARRNEVGRHVLLELGCQNTTRRFWWDFTTGTPTEDGRPGTTRRTPAPEAVGAAASAGGAFRAESNGSLHAGSNGHAGVSTLEFPKNLEKLSSAGSLPKEAELGSPVADISDALDAKLPKPSANGEHESEPVEERQTVSVEPGRVLGLKALAFGPGNGQDSGSDARPASLKEAFIRQLQLDRLTLRQMRSWLMSEEARRAIEVAAGATEATYERLALILFGSELTELLGKPSLPAQTSGMSAEDRLELQREKARIRARLRRAAAKAARQGE